MDEENQLPVRWFKKKILSLLSVNNVLIIQAPTGCGKTTQIPQYIMDAVREKKQFCNIVVALPTNIAVINITRRVCEERGLALGTVCGYEVETKKKTSSDTLLTYMPTNVLLRKLVSAQNLNQFTHIVIDDFHERSQDLDFLLLIVRRFLCTNSPNTKVILMSGPNDVDAQEFAQYFGSQHDNFCLPAPIIYANNESNYTRSVFYLEELDSVPGKTVEASIDIDQPQIAESAWKAFVSLVARFDKLDEKNPVTNKSVIGSVLVFLPGIKDIEDAKNRLNKFYENRRKAGKNKSKRTAETSSRPHWKVVSLHCYSSIDSQAQVLEPPGPECRKIILCTNLAENSITLPDACYVIDFCLTSVMRVNPLYKHYSLRSEWASHVSCEQRAGRVGRTGNGRVYRLVPSSFYNEKMPKWSAPEILLAPLERVVLQAKTLGLSETPREILSSAMYTHVSSIEDTVHVLKEIGGLLPTCEGFVSTSNGDLTYLGAAMAAMPLDVRLTKLIVLGHLFGCLEETIIIAAGCSISNTSSIHQQRKFGDSRKRDTTNSDFLDMLNFYQVHKKKAKHRWKHTKLANMLKEWSSLVTDIRQRLKRVGIKATTGPDRILLPDDDTALILNVITAGAFYPNYFINGEGPQTSKHDPLQMELRGCISSSANKTVDIEYQSVNTGLYIEPGNAHARLLVAAYICQWDDGKRWTLRQTSLLPDIPGLPMLLSLLFCPTMNAKLTDDDARVSSILCGAGFNVYTRRACYALHDLSLTLDTELTEDDVDRINFIRFQMNSGILLMSSSVNQMNSNERMIRVQNCLKKKLKELIFTPRSPVNKVSCQFTNDWKRNDGDVISKRNMCGDEDGIWPTLSFGKLKLGSNGRKYYCLK